MLSTLTFGFLICQLADAQRIFLDSRGELYSWVNRGPEMGKGPSKVVQPPGITILSAGSHAAFHVLPKRAFQPVLRKLPHIICSRTGALEPWSGHSASGHSFLISKKAQ